MPIRYKKLIILIGIISLFLVTPIMIKAVCKCSQTCSGCGSCCYSWFLWWCTGSCDCGNNKKRALYSGKCAPAYGETYVSCIDPGCICECDKACGAECETSKDCPVKTQTFYDFCDRYPSRSLVEYDNDCVKDETTVSCQRPCSNDCTCGDCTVSPPPTVTHCCKGVCGAECSEGETKSCTKSYTYKKCIGSICQSVTENFTGTQSCKSGYCVWGDCIVSNPPSDQCSTDADCRGESCTPGQTKPCTEFCTYKKCVGSSCSSVTEIVSGTQTCQSNGTWGPCSATCPSDQCSTNAECQTCSDSCDGYKLKDYNSDCQKNSGNCGGGVTRYTGGECGVCPLNNSSCSSKYPGNTQTTQDCVVPEDMWSEGDFTISHKVNFLSSATLTVKGNLILKSGGELTIPSGAAVIFFKGKEIRLQGGRIVLKGGYIMKK